MKHEYHEGREAVEKVEALMKKLFSATTPKLKEKPKPLRKPKETSKS